MFTNFLKVTLRNLYREKMYAIINIFGLALAIACCIILGLYLKSELTYDRHNTKYKQIFRVLCKGSYGINTRTSDEMGPMIAKDFPEIKGFVRFTKFDTGEEALITQGDKTFQLDFNSIFYADDNVFDIFTHDIIYGDPETALADPTSVAVSESFTKRIFGNASPVGEEININEKTYKITLVFADLPENTSLKYDMLVSYQAKELNRTNNNQHVFYISMEYCTTYLLMPEGYDVQSFKKISDSIYSNLSEKNRMSENPEYLLQPLSDIHLDPNVLGEKTANKIYIYGFTAVAVFILLVACINYINLATSRAAKRAKEVGTRKTLGASRMRLMFQFMGESTVFSMIALFLGLVLVEIALTLTPINQLLDKTLTLNFSNEPGLIVWMLAFSLAIGFMAGMYPALYLSSMPPLSALGHRHSAGKGSVRLREILVLIQFIITVGVITCTLLMALQMHYVSQKPLGFEKENRVVVSLHGSDLISKIPTIKTELSKNSGIVEITQSDTGIGSNVVNTITSGVFKAKDTDKSSIETMSVLSIDDNYIEVMGMQIVSGRDFSKELMADIGKSVIVNEAMVKDKGWKEPLGQSLMGYRVIGVVKDFHVASLHSLVEPLGMVRLSDSRFLSYESRQLILHISEKEIPETIKFLNKIFSEFNPRHPFQYEFLDESLAKHYLLEQRQTELTGVFAGICILISCMGLFGLTAFTTEQRTKEIGIRKVIGASIWQIIIMLSQRILLLVLGGAVVASLIAYYAMDEWLTGFAYRTGINPLVFLVSALLAAGVAFITVALQSYKTARANPVEALRYE